VIYEIKGGNTGHDIINALDNATMGPTYRAGIMREAALKKMHELMNQHKCDSVAFELLGPPRLSKLLYEAHLLRKVCGTMANVLKTDSEKIVQAIENLIYKDQELRASILSIGIPILLSDGIKLLRGPFMKIPPFRGQYELALTEDSMDLWAKEGWIDLRIHNIERWKRRIKLIFEEVESIAEDDTSSRFERDRNFWLEDKELNIGKVVGWIFSNEEHGLRMKD